MGPRNTELHEFIFGGNHRQEILSNNLPEIWGNALDDNSEDGYYYEECYEDDELDN
jgi:hypothetical protein